MTNQIQLPGYQDYLAALKNPEHFLIDTKLKSGNVVTGKRNRPITYSGNFALTVPFIVDEHQYAIRCFLHSIPGIAERYAAITRFVKQTNSEVLVDIEYQEAGILVNGSRYAICKMEWVDGLTLDKYIEAHLDHPAFLTFLPTQFIDLVQQLHALGCAHGDLQHGNIIADGTRLRLVDYDGMFVPEFEGRGLQATEIGHQNYQHPRRNAIMFHTKLDRFSSIAIFLSLKVIEHDPAAYDFDEDGAIYLKKEDFIAPDASPRIQKIAEIGYPVAAQYFRNICKDDIDRIPDLITFIQEDESLFDDLPGKTRRDISKGVAVVQRKKTTSAPKPASPPISPQKPVKEAAQANVTTSSNNAKPAFLAVPDEVPVSNTAVSESSSRSSISSTSPSPAFGKIPIPAMPANTTTASIKGTSTASVPSPVQATSSPIQPVPPAQPTAQPHAQNKAVRGVRLAQILRIPQIIILIAFFLPFATVFDGCSVNDEDNTVRETVTGYELATGTGIPEAQPLIFGVFVVAILCLVLTTIAVRLRFFAIAILSLFGLTFSVAEPDGYNTHLETGGIMVQTAFFGQIGLLLLLFIGNSVRIIFRFIRKRLRSNRSP